MKGKICLCPASIAWIRKHLMKSARKTFTKMIGTGSIKRVRRKTKRRRGKKQPWMIKGSASAKRHMTKVRRARR